MKAKRDILQVNSDENCLDQVTYTGITREVVKWEPVAVDVSGWFGSSRWCLAPNRETLRWWKAKPMLRDIFQG